MSVPATQMSGGSGLGTSTDGLDYIDPGNLASTWNTTPDLSGANSTATSPGSIGTGANVPTDTGGGILNDLSSFFGSGLGNLALYGGAAALGSSQASGAAAQNAQLAGGISAIGQPSVTASNQLLSAYGSGTLTTPFQQQLSSALTFNQQQATSQEQQVSQMLANSGGGENVQSAQAGQTQQIQAQQSQLNTQATAQAFAGELSASEGLLSAGGPYVQQGILSEIQSNQQLQQQLQQLFSGLASSYAQGQGGGTTGGGSAGGGGGSGVRSLINQVENQIGNANLASESASIQGTVDSQFGSAVSANGGYGLASDLGNVNFNDVAGSAASDTGSALGDIGYFSSAGGEAAAGAGVTDLGTVGLAGSVTADPAAAAAVDAAGGGTVGALGNYVPIVGAGLGAYSTVNSIEQGNALGGALSGATTGAEIGSFIGPEGTLIGGAIGGLVGLGGALIKGKHTEENIARVGQGQQVIKLQSGNSALQQGGVAFGAGSSRGQGSAQWFLVPQASGTLNKDTGQNAGTLSSTAEAGQPNVTKGTPFYVGTQASQILTNFANSVPTSGGQPNFSSYLKQYQQNPDADTGLVGVYNNNGGQAAWGQSFGDWLQSIWSVKHNVGGNLST